MVVFEYAFNKVLAFEDGGLFNKQIHKYLQIIVAEGLLYPIGY